MKLGVEVLLQNKKLLNQLKKRKVALICHPASVNHRLEHSFDLLHKKIKLACAFGPQHGVKGEKQDNMIESDDINHPVYNIPVYSLYGKVRQPTDQMMSSFDIALFDLQDVGCRIYTFITTLLYMMQACAAHKKSLIVLDRPNPAGREIEGLSLVPGFESFVGAAPIPMRHGLTVGELALYFKEHFQLNLDLQIIKMQGYAPKKKPGYGWPSDLAWVNPSPNIPTLNSTRTFPGTVMIEGTTLSEGRGTTRALELVGADDIDFNAVLELMKKKAPVWLKGVLLRECYFEPTFQKHAKQLCHGFQMHTDYPAFRPDAFKPFRIIALMLKCVRELYPQYVIYREFEYEYVTGKLAFDVITGSSQLRHWIENPSATIQDLEKKLLQDEGLWKKQSKKYKLYK